MSANHPAFFLKTESSDYWVTEVAMDMSQTSWANGRGKTHGAINQNIKAAQRELERAGKSIK
jgi:hypothetical protein